MEKETVVYMYAMQYYFALTKEILQFMTWVNLEDIRLSEISQAQGKKKKKCMTSLICGILKVKYTEAESRTIVTKGWKVGKLGRCWSKGTKLQLCRMNKPRDLK